MTPQQYKSLSHPRKPRKRGIGQEDQIHLNFGMMIQQYKFFNKLKAPIATYMPFGEQRTAKTGALLKKKGVIKGVPDWLFIKDNKGKAEMIWFEFKADKGKQSNEQIDFEVNCNHFDNMRYYMPRSVEEGLEILEQEQILIRE